MVVSTTKKVRLEPELVALLRELAEDLGITESEALRRGIRLLDRSRRRLNGIDDLIRAANEIPGEIIKWEGRV